MNYKMAGITVLGNTFNFIDILAYQYYFTLKSKMIYHVAIGGGGLW